MDGTTSLGKINLIPLTMLNKIDFENGQVVRRDYLNEVQKGTSFSGTPREDYYSEPNDDEQKAWAIGQRDKIKDWEISQPSDEPQSVLGRLVYDGMVMGYNPTDGLPTYGPAALVSGNNGYGVWVEGGTAILSDGERISWSRQSVQLIDGAQVNYIYLSEQLARAAIAENEPILLTVSPSLPSVTFPHIPLAKLTLNTSGDGLKLGEANNNSSVVGHGYIDLRPSTHIGNLNTYPRNLTNTDLLSESVQISTWKRAIVDTSNGSLVITLPSDPENSDRVAIADISGSFDKYPVIIRVPEDSDHRINGSVDDWIINVRDAHLELFFNTDTNQWKFEEAPGGECTPVLGTFLSCGGKEYIGERLPEECPDGKDLPATYPNPSEGVYQYELGTGKCYKKYHETVAIYANGQGGLIPVTNAPRCIKPGPDGGSSTQINKVRNIIYVDPSIGDDTIDNDGFDPSRPFRTPERALIEATRESRRAGENNDRYDKIVIELSPGDYYVDNSPGSGNTTNITSETGLIQKVSAGFTIQSSVQGDRTTVIQIDSGNVSSDQPPLSIKLGRVLYSESGGVGNISKLRKNAPNSSVWKITLEYVTGSFNREDELFYDNLSVVNPVRGGIIVPRGVSINGVDLRKVRIRPMYVPTLSPIQDDPQLKTSIWKVTGGSYISLQTFTDNLQYARSHNTVTSVTFASRSELAGDETTVSYYEKINSLFGEYDGWGGEGLEFLGSESTIVAPVPTSYNFRQQDNEENQTGLPLGDSRGDAPVSYPGAARITYSGDITQTPYNLPDVNSTRSSSPYIFNCSVRSIFGLNGLHADGSLVNGLKSMVTANFTQVSLQTDPNCFDEGTYYADPPSNELEGGAKRYKQSAADPFKYRNIGFRGNNDAVIQIVSCFVIGNSDHFVADGGGDLSITNSCSDFGDYSLKAIGFKTKAFSQDEGSPSGSYGGTRLLSIIPPKPLTYSLPNPTLEDSEISTRLSIDYAETLDYIEANSQDGEMPATYRVYIRNDDSNPYSLANPPSASLIGFGQFAYTKLNSSNQHVLTGGDLHPERKRIYLSGFDENANSISYAANLIVAQPNQSGFDSLDDKSKVFVWDGAKDQWYFPVSTGDILETNSPNSDGVLLKKLDYAFRFKILTPPLTTPEENYQKIDFIFDGSPIRIIRASDNRVEDDRVYRVVLSGFKKTAGIRRPQPFYVVEKQAGVAGGPLNLGNELGLNPLTVTSVETYAEALGFSPTDPSLPSSYVGKYVTYLVKDEDARKVFEGNIYPSLDYDEPENTEDPADSVTKVALTALLTRPGVWFSESIAPNTDEIDIKTSSGDNTLGIRIGLRRPSIIRASGHTWEWTGYLNYDTALPAFQNNPLDERFALGKIIDESVGGRVYATGMNEEGNYYIGTTVFDLRSGEQYAIPFKGGAEEAITNQVFSDIVIKNSLLMKDSSSVYFGKKTNIYFSNDTSFKSLTTGDISANSSGTLPGVYATRNRAGLVQLAKQSEIRGALGAAIGYSNRVVVTALQLTREFRYRLTGIVQEGLGINIAVTYSEPINGDPDNSVDDIPQYTVSVDPNYSGFTPVGGIIMWSGSIADIPTPRWRLCDGNYGTPDLRNRFIVGAGQLYSVDANGGEAEVTLEVSHMPAHDHGGLTEDAGAHWHTLVSAAQVGPNKIEIDAPGSSGSNTYIAQDAGVTNQYWDYYLGGTSTPPTLGKSGTAGDHNHAINSSGGGQAHENLPPYYALAYIMRVS